MRERPPYLPLSAEANLSFAQVKGLGSFRGHSRTPRPGRSQKREEYDEWLEERDEAKAD
jgi:hypothetical protein